jgi:arylsulfatase A-like enzyme
VDTPEERRDHADYYAHVTALDAQIGRLLAYLRERGALDDTLVVYSSDHGTMLGSHGHHNKQQPWEESINVPLLMRFGRRLPRGTASDLLIGIVDYAPTLLGLMGLPVPPAMQGRDLSRQILGESDDRPPSVFLAEHVCCDQAVRERLQPWRGVRTVRYTYARDTRGPWVLYDNLADPYQLRNLVQEPAARPLLEAMEAELQRWMERLDDPLLPADALLARYGLTQAWAEREAHFHPVRRG